MALITERDCPLAKLPEPIQSRNVDTLSVGRTCGGHTLTIYAVDGTVVRTLELGHQPVGVYQDRHRAVHWDGKNELGESVASGVYFYTLTAGEFKATRKMIIQK